MFKMQFKGFYAFYSICGWYKQAFAQIALAIGYFFLNSACACVSAIRVPCILLEGSSEMHKNCIFWKAVIYLI